MEKLEIINKIIENIENNQSISSNKANGIIFTIIGNRILKYFISIKELWQMPVHNIQDCDLMANLPKRLGAFDMDTNDLIFSVCEMDLLLILSEMENE